MNIQLILKSGERILIILLVATVLISLFSFYSLLSESVLSWLKGFIMGGAFAYGGYFLGTRIQKQGAINGLILMAIMIVISTIISLLLRENPLQMHSLIYKGLSAVIILLGMLIGLKRTKKKEFPLISFRRLIYRRNELLLYRLSYRNRPKSLIGIEFYCLHLVR